MNLTPLNKGYLPTSTPIQSHADSGYFGSCDKSSTKALRTLSPIKECSSSKKRFTAFIELTRKHSLKTPGQLKITDFEETQYSSSELVKELNFNDLSNFFPETLHDYHIEDFEVSHKETVQTIFPSFQIQDLFDDKIFYSNKILGSVEENCDNVYRQVSPNSNQNDNTKGVLFSPPIEGNKKPYEQIMTISKLRGKKIDFFEELKKIGGTSIISSILSFLSADDLCRICCVNKRWRYIVLHDTKANLNRKQFLTEEKARKENHLKKPSSAVQRRKPNENGEEHKTVLFNIMNVTSNTEQPLAKQYYTKFDSFVKEGKNIKSGQLMKCPICQYAAKSEDGDKYACTQCNYSFCRGCFNPFLKNHVCPKANVSILIGSKRSKKYLKRL